VLHAAKKCWCLKTSVEKKTSWWGGGFLCPWRFGQISGVTHVKEKEKERKKEKMSHIVQIQTQRPTNHEHN
jgi:hypothetical protein